MISKRIAVCNPRAGQYHAGTSVLRVAATANKHLSSGPMKELKMSKTGKMTIQAASRIYSATAIKSDGSVGKNTFGARAMRTAMGQVSPAGSPGQVKSKAKGSKK